MLRDFFTLALIASALPCILLLKHGWECDCLLLLAFLLAVPNKNPAQSTVPQGTITPSLMGYI